MIDVDPAAAVAALPITLPGDWITQGGAVSMLGLVVILILMGQLVPRRTVRSIEQERDLWRSVALKALGDTDALLPAAQITTQVAQALSDAAATSPIGPDAGGAR